MAESDEVLPISAVEFDPQNARVRTERSSYMIKESLQKFGPLRSLVGQRLPDGRIIVRAGNGTLEEAGQIGIDKVRIIERRPDELVVVVADDLDESAWKSYAIADNRSSDLSDWDTEILAELAADGVEVGDWFTADEMAAWDVEASDWDAPSEEQDEDNTADLIEQAEDGGIESRVKLGEIWALGRHRICCGDSTDEGNVRKLLGNVTIGLVHADPPYGMGKEKDGVQNDNLYRDKLCAFQMDWWNAARPYLEDNASAYIWGNAEELWRLWYSGGLKDSERLTFRSQVIWNKPPSAGPCGSPIGSEKMRSFPHGYEVCFFFMLGEQGFNNNADNYWEGWEPIRAYLDGERVKSGLTTAQCNQICGKQNMTQSAFTRGGFRLILEEDYKALQSAAKGKAFKREYDDLKREYDDLKREYDDLKREFYSTRAYFNNTHENMTDVWEYPRVQGEERWGHATPKPVDMISRIYKSSSPDDGVIYSPFLGSGTDVIAAQKMDGDRTVYGFELSEAYCTVIVERFERFTGQKAEIVGRLD